MFIHNSGCLFYFKGRSARDHTLSINLRRMKQMDLNFNDSRSDTNMTITVGTGRTWSEIYTEVHYISI